MRGVAHVAGAGLAGLAAALDLAEAGVRVVLHEAAAAPGGRCRSFHDAVLDRRIDNGNHLILSGNAAVLSHASRIGASDRLTTLRPEFPFADLATGARWTVRVPRTPFGALATDTRPPGAGRLDALAGVLGLMAGQGTVAQAVRGRGPMWRAFWEPMTTAVLNAPPEEAAAPLLRAALRKSFLKGASACRPVIAPGGLGPALIDPAVARLLSLGASLRTRSVLQGIGEENGRATALTFSDGPEALGPEDALILAVPPLAVAALLPGLVAPRPGLAILNAHFVVPPEEAAKSPPILGLIGSEAQWIFRREDVLSVTISAAERSPVWPMERDAALAHLWSEVARALSLGALQPLARRLLRERNATFDQSPAGAASRPKARTRLANLALAGDWTATGLPATLEGAVLSGRASALALLQQRRDP